MRYKVLGGNLTWPTGASLDLVRARGGLRFLTPTECAALTMQRPQPGDLVEDVPEESVASLLRKGHIVAQKEVSPHGKVRI